MLDPIVILAIILVVGIFYIIPILIIVLIYKRVKGKYDIKIANSILAFLIITFLFLCYTDFYPLQSSYSKNFEEKTELNFPESSTFLEKISTSSIFDFGDNMYCSKVKINNSDYLKLKSEIKNSKFIEVDNYTEDFGTDQIFSKIKVGDIHKIYRLRKFQEEYFIIFLSDNKTLILFYDSW